MSPQRIARMNDAELIANADEVIHAAGKKLSALCRGEDWHMSIPVQDDDSDVPIGSVIRLAKLLRGDTVNAQELAGLLRSAQALVEAVGRERNADHGLVSLAADLDDHLVRLAMDAPERGLRLDAPGPAARTDDIACVFCGERVDLCCDAGSHYVRASQVQPGPAGAPSEAANVAACKYWAIVEDVHELLRLDATVTGLDARAEQIRHYLREVRDREVQDEAARSVSRDAPGDLDEVRREIEQMREQRKAFQADRARVFELLGLNPDGREASQALEWELQSGRLRRAVEGQVSREEEK